MNSTRELSRPEFPKRLLEIPQPPKKLFVRGKLPSEDLIYLTIVGSRKYTSYGKEACETLIRGLKGLPVVIVSGLALGIDSIAHREAMKAGLVTMAVPGSGLDDTVLYPSSHKGLAKEIIERGGCLLSEFEPDFRATAWSFPQRNRIMAGLSHAVLVIEAEQKSGTLITSKYATDFNRDVFALPGSIFSKTSEGPHMLIRLGATPIGNASDLREALGFERESEKIAKTYDDCSPEERALLNLLSEPRERDTLYSELDMDIGAFNSVITLLEIKAYIKESGGKIHRV